MFCNRYGGAYQYRKLWERVTVLAEDAQPVGEIDRTKVEGRIRDLESDLSAADGAAKAPIQARLDVERARLAAAVVH